MAPAFGSISASSLTFVGPSQTTTVLCPSGTASGDLLLIIGQNEATNLYLVPSGFTLLAQPDAESADVGSGIFYRFATSSDVAGSTSYSVTQGTGGGTTSQVNVALCARYTGVDSSQFPFTFTYPGGNPAARVGLTHATTTTAASAACPTPTNPTLVGPQDLVVRVYMSGNDATGTGKTMSATPTNWSERGRYITNVSSKFNQGSVILDRVGATDTATMTSNRLSMWDVYTIVLPAPDNGAGWFPYTVPGHHHHNLTEPRRLHVPRRGRRALLSAA